VRVSCEPLGLLKIGSDFIIWRQFTLLNFMMQILIIPIYIFIMLYQHFKKLMISVNNKVNAIANDYQLK
jgi:hypothetical protein